MIVVLIDTAWLPPVPEYKDSIYAELTDASARFFIF